MIKVKINKGADIIIDNGQYKKTTKLNPQKV